ncbi:polygalacturonase [Tamlana nanhaiensis]|uniref:Polygalacturonase n=1 Tax=Neotamlana nanhaiensis TaxID=1382798 RepID=A0A0D7W6L9_9FLAO|nr:glycoside hydrolase family 28 protein [Tamlana nanhaiensis]KJD34756.1 polygalacturonase [Tamlana nanhaiensis]
MKNISLLALITLIGFVGCKSKEKPAITYNTTKVEAPFDMPEIKTPNFTNCDTLNIVDFGAVASDKNKTSLAIEKAITQANENGCGVVLIPKGEWLTKKLHFKSNINLHLSEGAVLLFSENPEDYLPAVHTTWEGMECYNYSPLIYAYNCENIAITGKGELKAKMDVWKTWFSRPRPHMNSLKHLYNLSAKNPDVKARQMVNDSAHLRPQFIQFNRSKHILLEDVKITNSPFWTIHPYLSKDIIIRNLNVYAHGHNNDGVDPEMSQNMLIENCFFDQGDDAIAVKSGRNQDAWRLNTPTKNLVIKNSTVKNGHQLLAIGSELSGGVENVYMDNCEVLDGAKLFHLVFIKTNERRGGYVKNIFVKNITSGKIDKGILGIETDVLYQWRDLVPTYETRLTPISNVYLENFNAGNVEFVSRILAQEALPAKTISLKNIACDTIQGEPYIHENVVDFTSTNTP